MTRSNTGPVPVSDSSFVALPAGRIRRMAIALGFVCLIATGTVVIMSRIHSLNLSPPPPPPPPTPPPQPLPRVSALSRAPELPVALQFQTDPLAPRLKLIELDRSPGLIPHFDSTQTVYDAKFPNGDLSVMFRATIDRATCEDGRGVACTITATTSIPPPINPHPSVTAVALDREWTDIKLSEPDEEDLVELDNFKRVLTITVTDSGERSTSYQITLHRGMSYVIPVASSLAGLNILDCRLPSSLLFNMLCRCCVVVLLSVPVPVACTRVFQFADPLKTSYIYAECPADRPLLVGGGVQRDADGVSLRSVSPTTTGETGGDRMGWNVSVRAQKRTNLAVWAMCCDEGAFTGTGIGTGPVIVRTTDQKTDQLRVWWVGASDRWFYIRCLCYRNGRIYI